MNLSDKISFKIPENAKLNNGVTITPRHKNPEKISAADGDPVNAISDLTSRQICAVLNGLQACFNAMPEKQNVLEDEYYQKMIGSLQALMNILYSAEISAAVDFDKEPAASEDVPGFDLKITPDRLYVEKIQRLSDFLHLAENALNLLGASEKLKANIQSVINIANQQIASLKPKEDKKDTEKTEEDKKTEAKIKGLQDTISNRNPRLKSREKRHNELLSKVKIFIESLDKSEEEAEKGADELRKYLIDCDLFETEEQKKQFLEGFNQSFETGLQVYLEKEDPKIFEQKKEIEREITERVGRFKKYLIIKMLIMTPLLALGIYYTVNRSSLCDDAEKGQNRQKKGYKLSKEPEDHAEEVIAYAKGLRMLSQKFPELKSWTVPTDKDLLKNLDKEKAKKLFLKQSKELIDGFFLAGKIMKPGEEFKRPNGKDLMIQYGLIGGEFAYARFTLIRANQSKINPALKEVFLVKYVVNVEFGGALSGTDGFAGETYVFDNLQIELEVKK